MVLICTECHQTIKVIQSPYCPCCGLPFESHDNTIHLCSRCLRQKFYFELHRSCGLYEGALKDAIHKLKYLGEFSTVKYLATLLHTTLQRCFETRQLDVIVPIPLHIRRLRERGFNQSVLLARELSKRATIPLLIKALRKTKETPVQTALTASERRKNLRGAFEVAQKGQIQGKSVLLIDDVYTTGATVNECARTLLDGEAKTVSVLTVARTI